MNCVEKMPNGVFVTEKIFKSLIAFIFQFIKNCLLAATTIRINPFGRPAACGNGMPTAACHVAVMRMRRLNPSRTWVLHQTVRRRVA